MWRGTRDGGRPWFIALIALIGVVAVLLSYQTQFHSSLSRDTAAAVTETSSLRLNELMSENTATLITASGDVPDWVELKNTGSSAIDLTGYSMLLTARVNKIFSFPKLTLEPGGFVTVYLNGSTAQATAENLSAPFKLAASGGDTLVLMNAQGGVIDSVTTPELGNDAAYCRADDGSWQESGTPTPNAENVFDQAEQEASASQPTEVQLVPGEVELSEVMTKNTLYAPDENGQYSDYVELHNTSSSSVNLSGWYLSDSSQKLKRWSFPSVTLPADGYLVVHCSGYDRTDNPAQLHTDFKLSKDGATVYLSDADGRTVSMVKTPALEDGQAYSLFEGSWTTNLAPTPGRANDYDAAAQLSAERFAANPTGVYISEIMASATSQKYDWVEIYNGSGQAFDLSGCGLSDNAAKPRKWQFPSGTSIAPGQYLGVYLSGSSEAQLDGFLNASFALSSEGGYQVCLSTSAGEIFDNVYLPQQYGGVSYGRVEGQSGLFYLASATPGTANGGSAYRAKASAPVYSVRGGLFTTGDSFQVELSAPAGSRIYYTLDSSDPTESSTLYSGPIPISATTILRTRVYRDGYLESYMDTQSYLYDVNNPSGVYVISLVSDPYGLTSDETGIMVKGPNATAEFPYGSMNKGANFWMDWEREAHVEMYLADGTQALSQECGIKLHGQYSRATSVKAFKVIARSEYGDNRFSYPIFSNRDYTEYQSFVLRCSGQDYDKTFMRDSVLTGLALGSSVDYQETEVAICYLDGQYYSLYNIRERVNAASICQFEGWEGMEDDVDLIKANSNVMQGSNASFEELLSWVKSNDTSTAAAYDYIGSRIDIQNYIEYMSYEIFSGNTDTLNVKRYRNAKVDGKWRWVLFDLDWAFTTDTNSIKRWVTSGGMGNGGRTDNTLFIACMKNPTFRDEFLTFFGQQLATTFSTENVMAKAEERYNIIRDLLPDYQARWNMTESAYNAAMKVFTDYAKERPTKLLEYFQGVFNFSDSDLQKYFGDAIAKIQSAS